MSRIGQQPITIPQGITVTQTGDRLIVKSAKTELTHTLPAAIQIKLDDQQVLVTAKNSSRQTRALHGLTRSLIANMIQGLEKGFEKVLELQGTGYRAHLKGDTLELSLGFSHPIVFPAPAGITLAVEDNKIIKITGADKQLVGQVAAKIRAFRPPDAYKGKGVRYQDEVVHLKPGKSAKTEA